ncbi:hypothetical protein G9A89_003529 [Geosiphon pyriformis]|nr:hypothetical protein G9A89_003529 [Geosiphon pyriformis]
MNYDSLRASYTLSTSLHIDRCSDLSRIDPGTVNQQLAPVNPSLNPLPAAHNNPAENISTILTAQNIDFTVKEEFIEPTFVYSYRPTNTN